MAQSPTSAPPPRRGDVLDGRFELLDVIGRGASGEVFAARDRHSGDRVAVKVLDGEPGRGQGAAEGLTREAHTLARLHHPNIVALRVAGTLPGGRAYLVMEELRGHTLGQWLRRTPRLTASQLAPVLTAIATALDAAHEAGVVHGDVRADNVFLLALDSRAKLLDFGVARFLGEPSSDASAGASTTATAAQDVAALAALCGRALAGAPASGEPPLADPRVPAEQAAVLRRGLAGEFASAGQLVQAWLAAAGLPWPESADPSPSYADGLGPAGEHFSAGRGSSLPAEPPSWMPAEPLRVSSAPPPPAVPVPGISPRALGWLAAVLCVAAALLLWWLR